MTMQKLGYYDLMNIAEQNSEQSERNVSDRGPLSVIFTLLEVFTGFSFSDSSPSRHPS